jgi:uncharacterized LabA/DUF88 family protein
MKTAILVDGGFYRKMAKRHFGEKNPAERAQELFSYCKRHLKQVDHYIKDDTGNKQYHYSDLYRIFYYGCPPVEKNVFHPLTQKTICFKKHPTYVWMNTFLKELKTKRKFALRLGFLTADAAAYTLNANAKKKLFNHSLQIEDIQKDDFTLSMIQKGVDMKIGLDIASLSYKKQVDQIVLISGDSDFVPAAKLAKLEGIDFILDPMGHPINDALQEHIDGLRSYYSITMNTSADSKA